MFEMLIIDSPYPHTYGSFTSSQLPGSVNVFFFIRLLIIIFFIYANKWWIWLNFGKLWFLLFNKYSVKRWVNAEMLFQLFFSNNSIRKHF